MEDVYRGLFEDLKIKAHIRVKQLSDKVVAAGNPNINTDGKMYPELKEDQDSKIKGLIDVPQV